MKLREHIQNGKLRPTITIVVPVVAACLLFRYWPVEDQAQNRLISGLQKIAFVSAAFAVTAYNLRTRVIDLVLKIESSPTQVAVFCRTARDCGKKLTDLVLLFTITSLSLGALTLFNSGSVTAKYATLISVALFTASCVSFIYILFSFERLERFALDQAEHNARVKETNKLLIK